MRVLLVSGSFPDLRCGVGDYTYRLAESLARREGLEVAVLTSEGATVGPTQLFTVFAVIRKWSLSCMPRVLKVARQWRPDVVHIQFPTQGYLGTQFPWFLPLVFHLAGYRVVQTWHEYYRRIGLRSMLPFMAKGMVRGGLVVVRPNYEEQTPRAWRWSLRNKLMRFVPNSSALPPARLTEPERAGLRSELGVSTEGLVAYFGFSYPAKRVELLFEIANPSRHRLLIIGHLSGEHDYHKKILGLAESAAWSGRVKFAGFVEPERAARLIAVADAVVLPFKDGGGEWNTSIHGAQTQGTFVLTTSRERRGYDAMENTYYAVPDDVAEMRQALLRHIGNRRSQESEMRAPDWAMIARTHLELYEQVARTS